MPRLFTAIEQGQSAGFKPMGVMADYMELTDPAWEKAAEAFLHEELEYVVVHEMLHLIEPTHSERFLTLMSKHYPGWRETRAELNELPLGAETWNVQSS